MYNATKWIVRNGLKLYLRKIHIDGLQYIPTNKPALLVANHPNAFLDALIIAAFMERPIHFLARGDAFNNKLFGSILKSFNLMPVYRISEGKENIGKNTSTFDATQEILKKNGMVLIFGEGWCEQNWDLRPLKKGSARIAERAWSEPQTETTVIVPIGLTYEHFDGGGKSVIMSVGKAITPAENTQNESGAAFVKWLNSRITESIKTLAYFNPMLQINSTEHQQIMRSWKKAERNKLNILEILYQPIPTDIKAASASILPSGFHKAVITLPHYWAMQIMSKLFTKGTVFYDSVLFALVVLFLPAYLALLIYLVSILL